MIGRTTQRLRVITLLMIPLVYLGATLWSYETIPSCNTDARHFDVILVLGTPSLPDGSPSPEQRSRVLEGIRELRAGRAPRIVMTGGAAHNQFVEAHTMVEFAQTQGVPEAELIEEGRAQNTIQNIFYSRAVMDQHGWKSAEVVSSPSHLPRTALILEHYAFPWRTHAATWPNEFSSVHVAMAYWMEATYCAKLRWTGFKPTSFLPR